MSGLSLVSYRNASIEPPFLCRIQAIHVAVVRQGERCPTISTRAVRLLKRCSSRF
jgi:hypothetical protein